MAINVPAGDEEPALAGVPVYPDAISNTCADVSAGTELVIADSVIPDRAKKRLLNQIKKALKTEERVIMIGGLIDKWGIDPIVGLMPFMGDIGAEAIMLPYFLCEAVKLGLSRKYISNIIAWQCKDMGTGLMPVIGDIADMFYKGNKMSALEFQKWTNELILKAKRAGVPEDEINALVLESREFSKKSTKLFFLIRHAFKRYRKFERDQLEGL